MNRCWIYVMSIAFLGALEQPTSAQMPPPPFKLIRYEENYQYLVDKANRTNALDALKFIPFNERGEAYLSLGGDMRQLYEYYSNPEWGLEFQGANGYLLQRYMLHADFHVGKTFRLFGQLSSGVVNGKEGGASPVDKDELDVHQLFTELNFPLDSLLRLQVRIGRQEMVYGSSRLVTVRDGPNVRLAFDGIRAIASSPAWTVNLFATRPVRNQFERFDNPVLDSSRALFGIYATIPTPVQGAKADFYYIGLERTLARFNQGREYELRHSVGTRLFGNSGEFDYNLEAIYQFGRFGSGTISAWTASMNVGYTLSNIVFSPRFGLKAELISGDGDKSNPDLHTFNPLFPRGAYFGGAGLIGPANLNDVHPSIEFTLLEDLTLAVDWDFFWRNSSGDGVYGVVGQFALADGGSESRFIGHQSNVEIEWAVNRYITLYVQYDHFFAGAFLAERNLRSVNFFTSYLQIRF